MLRAKYYFVRSGTGYGNIPLQLRADGSNAIVELRCHSLSRASLHFPDGFLKVVHAGTDAAHDFLSGALQHQTVQ